MICVDVSSRILQGPRDRTVYNGSTVNFHCTSDKLTDIYWRYKTAAMRSSVFIFGHRGRNDKLFGERFVKTVRNSNSTLTIHDVRNSDAGSYFCLESTSESYWSAQLTVIGQYKIIASTFFC